MNRPLIIGLFSIMASLAISCGGGDDELAKAVEDLRSRDLAIMVLPLAEWGDIAAGFGTDTDSGPQDNEAAADDSIDPDDDAGTFEEAGRQSGYELSFSHPDFLAALKAGEGLLGASSGVELFGTADEARAAIEKKLAELDKYEGEEVDGVVLGSHTHLDVEIGDHDSGGVTFTSSIPALEVTAYTTVVFFRIDRLLAQARMGAADDRDLQDEVERAARSLEKRIRGVALGEIDEEPVAIPEEPEGADVNGGIDPPPGVPDLSRLALRLDDLPEGFTIEEERYDPPPDKEFTRSFEVESGISVAMGDTDVIALQSIVSLFDEVLEAQLAVSAFEAILTSESARELFVGALVDRIGNDAAVRELRSADVGQIGDQSVVIVGIVETPLTNFTFAFTAVRVGALVSLVNVTALAKDFDLDDVMPLLRLEAERLTGEQ